MSEVIHVKLPDGSIKEVPKGTTALEVAKSISPRLADAALAAKTNGDLIDLDPAAGKRHRSAPSYRKRSGGA